MITVRVSAGSLKGRALTLGKEYGSADITPQKLKQAFFSIIGESLEGRKFLDLYACSGQVGIEAVSRGAELTVINELDRGRFGAIHKLIEDFALKERVILMNSRAVAALRRLAQEDHIFDYVYADPPYVKKKGPTEVYDEMLETVALSGVLASGGLLVLQHFSGSIPSEHCGSLVLTDTRNYGTSALSLYNIKATTV